MIPRRTNYVECVELPVSYGARHFYYWQSWCDIMERLHDNRC